MSTKTTTASAGAQWFALHTLSGQENKVKNYIERFKVAEELDDAIFEVLLPTEVVSEVKNGKKSSKVRKLYPGYDLWRDFPYEYELGKLPIDVINGGPALREWVDDPAATPADLDALTTPDEASWVEERRPYLLY